MFGKRIGKAKWVYMDQAGEGGSDSGGGGETGAAAIAAGLAAKAAQEAADAAAAKTAQEAADAAAAAKAAGKTGPSDEEARLLKENMKKKEALVTAQAELVKLNEQLKQFEGIDVEVVKQLLAEQKTAEEKQLAAKGDWERLKQRMADEHAKELKAIKDALVESEGKNKVASGQINELSIGSLFSQSKFIADELTLTPAKARVIYAEHFDLEDGKVVGYDKPRGDKNRTAIVDSSGNSLDFESAMRSIVEADPEKDHLFRSKLKPGASSDSRKVETKPGAGEKSSIEKITEGLKGLKLTT